MINVRGFELKNSSKDFTVNEFEKITNILNELDSGAIEKFVDIFNLLELPEEIASDLTDDEFEEIVKSMYEKEDISSDFFETIEINGKTYRSHSGEFKMKVKDMMIIEKHIRTKPEYFATMLAVIFKEEGIIDHYEDSHIKDKIEIFGNQIVDKFIPHIVNISLKMSIKFKNIADFAKETTKELE